MRSLGAFFGFKFLELHFFVGGGVQKYKYFWGYEDFVNIFGGSRQNWTSFRCLFYVFRVFSYGKCKE